MIDLHCHILPFLDDGSRDNDMSLDMAREAISEGITTIVATPHHQNGQYVNEKKRILQHVQKLRYSLEQAQIPLTILPGQETRLNGDFLKDYHEDKILTLNDTKKYVFVEFSSTQVPNFTTQLLFEMQSRGLIPIIVHPERNRYLIEEPTVLYEFINRGALAQVTAGSLIGKFGRKVKKFSHQLIDSNLIHFVSSDAHNLGSRSFYMRKSLEVIKEEHGQGTVQLFKENAHRVIKGEVCLKESPEEIKKGLRTFWSLIL